MSAPADFGDSTAGFIGNLDVFYGIDFKGCGNNYFLVLCFELPRAPYNGRHNITLGF